jgi:hypothetical protein
MKSNLQVVGLSCKQRPRQLLKEQQGRSFVVHELNWNVQGLLWSYQFSFHELAI